MKEKILEKIKDKKYKDEIKLLFEEEIKKELILKYKDNFNKIQKQIEELKVEKQKSEEIIERLKEKEKYFEKLEQEIKKNEKKKENLEEKIAQFKEKENKQKKGCLNLNKSLEELEIRQNNYKKIIEEGMEKEEKIKFLNKEIQDLELKLEESEILERKVNNLKEEVIQEKRRKNQLEEENTLSEECYKKIKQAREDSFRILIKDLENKKNSLEKNIEELNDNLFKKKDYFNNMINKENELNERENRMKIEKDSLNSLCTLIDMKKEKVKEIEKILRKEIEEEYADRLERRKEEMEKREDEIQDLKDENRELENELDMYKNNYDYKKILEDNNFLKREVKELNKKLVSRKDEIRRELEETLKIKNILEEKNGELLKKYTEEETKAIKLMEYKDNVESYKSLYEEKEADAICLIKKIEELREENIRIKEKHLSREEKIISIEQKQFDVMKNKSDQTNEMKWLDNISSKFKKIGFKFSKRLLYAFHTSLKVAEWSPLTVLAGVSGTGKSELPKLYSRYGGLYFLPLAVQPDWDSPQSLFGYYNSLEGKFNATTLLKTLYQAQAPEESEYSLNKYIILVLLDEMNLAHVELYFSELLSKLEIARGSKKGVDLEIDIAEAYPYTIKLDKNILWAGTMNEDETTKTLSDKVIDRGNILNFPKPRELKSREKLIELEVSPKLERKNWENWKWDNSKNDILKDKIEEYRTALDKINEYMDISGRAIGHRVWQSIENYIKNHPMVMANLEDEERLNKYMKCAFEDALVLKVMPKLRGLETNGEIKTECLDKIKEVIMDKADGILSDFEKSIENIYGVFIWESSKYLESEYKENE